MYVPVVRMIDTAFKHATLGVGAQLALLVLDEGDDKRPQTPYVINTADSDVAAQGQPSGPQSAPIRDFPALVVAAETPSTIQVTGVLGKAFDIPNLLVHVMYVTGDLGDPAESWRDADYTFRCAVHALNAALFASNMESARVKGKVRILAHNTISYSPAYVILTKGRIVGVMTIDLHVRVNP